MARSNGGKAKAFFRTTPSGAFDQYLQDIQKLPLIKDPAEERRLARRVQRGDEKAAERLVTANLRFVISYVKKYQGHGLDLSELVAIGNEGLLKAVKISGLAVLGALGVAATVRITNRVAGTWALGEFGRPLPAGVWWSAARGSSM